MNFMRSRPMLIAIEVIATLAILTIVALLFQSSASPYFPSFEVIGRQLATDWDLDGLKENLLPSVVNLLVGFLLAGAIGITGGVLLGLSSVAYELCAPLLAFLRSLPPVALLPIFIVMLGIDESMKIVFITFGALWPTLLGTTDAVRAVDPLKISMAKSFNTGRLRLVTLLVVPSAGPAIFAGLRVTLQMSLVLMVISEIRAATSGIGYTIMDAQTTFNIPRMWAAMVVLGIVGYLVSFVLVRIEDMSLSWYHGERGRVAH